MSKYNNNASYSQQNNENIVKNENNTWYNNREDIKHDKRKLLLLPKMWHETF
jgi:hypothetical protein